jgi:hypothetical protein
VTRELLIGKLVGKFNNYNFYSEVRASRFAAKERIKDTLFMGAGYHSVVQMNNLHKRLEFACSELGGLQQNGGMGTEFDEQMDFSCKDNIKSVLKDMILSFNLTPEDLCSQ